MSMTNLQIVSKSKNKSHSVIFQTKNISQVYIFLEGESIFGIIGYNL